MKGPLLSAPLWAPRRGLGQPASRVSAPPPGAALPAWAWGGGGGGPRRLRPDRPRSVLSALCPHSAPFSGSISPLRRLPPWGSASSPAVADDNLPCFQQASACRLPPRPQDPAKARSRQHLTCLQAEWQAAPAPQGPESQRAGRAGRLLHTSEI